MKRIFTLMAIAFYVNGFGQITFQRTYGGTISDVGYAVQQTYDSGYVVAGLTQSFGVGNRDVYLLKTDSLGNLLWTKTFGGSSEEYAWSLNLTYDGGFIITGHTSSFSVDNADVYLIKTDNNGNLVWAKTFGGVGSDEGRSVQQTADSGYVIVGMTTSFGAGDYDVYLIKTDSNGNLIWSKTFGGISSDCGYSVQQTTDKGFIIIGRAGFGTGGIYVLKTDSSGTLMWSKTYNGSISGNGSNSLQQTTDDGFILLGAGSAGILLIKTDSIGNIQWSKGYQPTTGYLVRSVRQCNDGGYIIAGRRDTSGYPSFLTYALKTDSVGNLLWSKTYGLMGVELSSVQQTTDGYIFAGADGGPANRVYLIKTDSNGNSNCNQINAVTAVHTANTTFSIPPTIFSNPATISTSPATIVGNGGDMQILCFDDPTNIVESSEENNFLISPNPAANELVVRSSEFGDKTEIEIYNVLGEKCLTPALSKGEGVRIDVSLLPEGIYFVKVRGEKEERVAKFVKQ